MGAALLLAALWVGEVAGDTPGQLLTSLGAFGKNSIRIRVMGPSQTALADPPISVAASRGAAATRRRSPTAT